MSRSVGSFLGAELSRRIRKSVSCEPILDFSSEDEDRGGDKDSNESEGASLSIGSLTPSPAGKKIFLPKKSVSESAGSRSPSSESFKVGTNVEDDVFATNNKSSQGENTGQPSLTDRFNELKCETEAYEKQQLGDPSVSSNNGAVDAQDIYPPTACIFVANLSQNSHDQALEFEVTRVFSQFGPVFVKIRRDSRQMPFAFCQFTDEAHAIKAESAGKGTVILGRPCRIEMVRAHTSFIVEKISGGPTDPQEVFELLSTLGEVAKVERLPASVEESYGTTNSILATYKMYDPQRDVIQHFRRNRYFRVVAYDPKNLAGPKQDLGSSLEKTAPLVQYDADCRSAYFGNLPLDMTEDSVKALAETCGTVVSVQVMKRPIVAVPGKVTCFAFVEYARPDAVDGATRVFNNTEIDGYQIRVQRKESRSFETPKKAYNLSRQGYQYATFPRRRTDMIQRGRPLKTLFVPPSDMQSTAALDSGFEQSSILADEEPLPSNVGMETPESTKPIRVIQSTGKRVNMARSRGGFGGSQDDFASQSFPQPNFSASHQTVPWVPYSPYPYGPMPHFPPIQPHPTGTGMVYPGFLPSPVYHHHGMYPEFYSIVSPTPTMPSSSDEENIAATDSTPTRFHAKAEKSVQGESGSSEEGPMSSSK